MRRPSASETTWFAGYGALMVSSTWLPPGGSCHDEISALRNRYFVVTDEGWRTLKVSDFPVEWRKLEHMPRILLHSKTDLPPPLISLFCQSVPKRRLAKNPASPRGVAERSESFKIMIAGGNHSMIKKPRTQKHLAIAMQKTTLLRILAGDMPPCNEGI